jgi:hypothetical protein
MRLRILFGTLVLILGLAAYGLVVAALAAHVLPSGPFAALLFYAVAGVAWLAPAACLVRWMQKAAPFRPPPTG